MLRCKRSPTLHTCSSTRGGWWYTAHGRAVKLSSAVILPPFTAGSAHIHGLKEAKGRVTNPSIAIKHTSLPHRKMFPYCIFSSVIICDAVLAASPSPHNLGKLFISPRNVLLFVWLSSTYISFTLRFHPNIL